MLACTFQDLLQNAKSGDGNTLVGALAGILLDSMLGVDIQVDLGMASNSSGLVLKRF